MKAGAVHCAGSVPEVVTEDRLRELYGLDFEITQGARGRLCNYFNPSGELK
jgi:iron complex transport system ATP-binding protein